jgi:hypothetical protein
LPFAACVLAWQFFSFFCARAVVCAWALAPNSIKAAASSKGREYKGVKIAVGMIDLSKSKEGCVARRVYPMRLLPLPPRLLL